MDDNYMIATVNVDSYLVWACFGHSWSRESCWLPHKSHPDQLYERRYYECRYSIKTENDLPIKMPQRRFRFKNRSSLGQCSKSSRAPPLAEDRYRLLWLPPFSHILAITSYIYDLRRIFPRVRQIWSCDPRINLLKHTVKPEDSST
jgi:hypothetical protein